LRQSISTLLGLGLSGFAFAGCDLGGFDGSPTGELYTRWLQTGVFFPFMRAHSTWGSPDKEPWAFDSRHEIINRHAIELRYELLPYLYDAMQRASQTGVPALRPLFLEFPEDEKVAGMDDEFLFGDDLLVAPVLYEGVSDRTVYLPEGEWFDYWTGRRLAGRQTIHLPVTLESIPLFVRGGGFIFRQPVVQHTGEMPGKPLRVLVAPASESESSLYEDDGETLDYRTGAFMQRRFHQVRTDRKLSVDVSGPEGTYRPTARDLVFETWMDREPENVFAQTGEPAADRILLPHLNRAALALAPQGWSFADGLLSMKVADSFKPVRFDVER
jgi:alpha-glucosidase